MNFDDLPVKEYALKLMADGEQVLGVCGELSVKWMDLSTNEGYFAIVTSHRILVIHKPDKGIFKVGTISYQALPRAVSALRYIPGVSIDIHGPGYQLLLRADRCEGFDELCELLCKMFVL